MWTIFFKELNDFFNSLIAYTVIVIFLITTGLLMWVFPDTNVLDYGYASMQSFFLTSPYAFMLLIPAVTMKSFAEEQRIGTIERLLTLPFTMWQIVMGKFLASFAIVVVAVLLTITYVGSLYFLGQPQGNLDLGSIGGSYIALLMLGAVFTGLGVFISALSPNQIVSFIISCFICFFLYSGLSSLADINIWSQTSYFLKFFSASFHYLSMSNGHLLLSDMLYFLSITVLFIYLSVMYFQFQTK